jgi:hypothetical protein
MAALKLAALEPAALKPKESLETLDVSSYKCIYISFGSKNGSGKLPFYHDFPFFLEMINKYPLCTISIDDYPDYTKEDVKVPYGALSDDEHPRKQYTRVKIPSRSMDETIRITQHLVALLDKIEAQVFFVNYIKYKDKTAHDSDPEREAIRILQELGKFREHYYDWYGFGLFKDFIIKSPSLDILERIKVFLYFKDAPDFKPFLIALKEGDLSKVKPSMQTLLSTFLIDITPEIRSEQIMLFDPDYSEFNVSEIDGGRKRRRRRKTRRKVWR